MSSGNGKRRTDGPLGRSGRGAPTGSAEKSVPSTRPSAKSNLPSRAPVRWAAGDEVETEAWHADWDGDDDVVEDDLELVSELPEESALDDDEAETEDLDEDEDEAEEVVEEAPVVVKRERLEIPADASADEEDGDDDEKRRGRRRSKTIARKQMLRERRRMLAQGTIPEIVDYERPVQRAECRDEKRPCLYVSCRYHLYLDVNPETGSIKLNFPDKEVWELEETCALDVAERGGITLEEVGEIMNLTRERIRQVEVSGLEKLKTGEVELHTFIDGHELEIGPPPTGGAKSGAPKRAPRAKTLPVVE